MSLAFQPDGALMGEAPLGFQPHARVAFGLFALWPFTRIGSTDVCEYCGCRGVPPIAELMDEHTALVDQASHVREDLGSGDPVTAMARLTGLVAHLERHVRREEAGIFQAMRRSGEFVDEIDALEGEHRDFAEAIAALDIDSADFAARVTALLDDLEVHVEREDLGIFPVSVVTLGATGWAIVDEAHTSSPSFLHDQRRASVAVDPHGLRRS